MKKENRKGKKAKEARKPSPILKSLQKKISSPRKTATLSALKKDKKQSDITVEKIAVMDVAERGKGTALDNGYNAELFKFNLSQEAKFDTAAAALSETNIPERYADDRIVLMARDPWWIYTYWDISDERKNAIANAIPDEERNNCRLIIRVYDVTDKHFNGSNAHYFFDIDVPTLNSNWYIHTNNPGRSFCVEIGLLTLSGAFHALARSNSVTAPRYGISNIIDELWMLPDEEFFKLMSRFSLTTKSSFQEKREIEWESFFEQLFKSQVSSGEFSSLFSFLGKEKRKREFFLEVWTDVIVYGRTEADASVTLCGKKVALSKEGTFKAHFTLPKGKFSFPVEATSYDGADTLKLTPAVERKE